MKKIYITYKIYDENHNEETEQRFTVAGLVKNYEDPDEERCALIRLRHNMMNAFTEHFTLEETVTPMD